MRRREGRLAVITLATVATLLIGVQAVRVAAVEGLGGGSAADLLWAGHPRRILDRELTTVGQVTGRGEAPAPATLARINQVALNDPLAFQPFLVAGTAALAAGQRARATQLLHAAIRHDPRDPTARLLLADQALGSGDLATGMSQVAALARLFPGGAAALAPALASYARQPGGAIRLAPFLSQEADLRSNVLAELATNQANAQTVLQLAGKPTPPNPGTDWPVWQGRLIESLVNAGRFDEAQRLWTRFSGKNASQEGLIDAGFGDRSAPPPFGWTLTSGSEGSADPDEKGGLQILYYGRNDVVLASQVATLPPGTYRLSLTASGGGEQNGQSLAWVVTCLRAKSPLARLPLEGKGERALSASFRVPAGCSAQSFSLTGTSPEFPATAALGISALRLDKVAG